MELEFATNQINFLRAVVDRVIGQEETGEAVVPDAYPDMSRTAGCFGTVLLRAKECREGSVLLSGGIMAYALAVPEDGGEACSIPVYLPFSQRVEAPGATSDSRVVYTPRLRALDARLVNSRKVLVRADLCARVEVYAPETLSLHAPGEFPPSVQTHRVTMPLTLTEQVAEKSFELREELELPGSSPACAALLKWDCCLLSAEQRTIGERAVFRGSAQVCLLCRAEDGALFRHMFSVPFSQYVELDRESGEGTPRVVLVCTGAELTPDGQEPARRFLLTLNILAQCVAQTRTELAFVDDLYSTQGETETQTQPISGSALLDVQRLSETVRVQLPGGCREILDTTVLYGFPEIRHEEEQVSAVLPARVSALCVDGDGALACVGAQTQAECHTVLAAGCNASGECALAGDVIAVPGIDGADVRFGVDFTVCCAATCEGTMVTSALVREAEDEVTRPSVIVRAVEDGETLWSIAKACRTSVSAVQSANALDDDPPEGTLLLIPRA